MEIVSLGVDEVKLILPHRHEDNRGYFVETWSRAKLAEGGIEADFVQDNCSFSRAAGTIRGLHYQTPPAAQAKLVRVVRGAIFDVAVDLRRSSPTRGRPASAVLTAGGGEQLYIPIGFAHGFCTMEPDTEVAYKVSAPFSPENNAGIIWNDPDIGIGWPLKGGEPVLSGNDLKWPRLFEIAAPF